MASVLEELISTYCHEKNDENLKVSSVVRLCEIVSNLNLLNAKKSTKSHKRFVARALELARNAEDGSRRWCGAVMIHEIMSSGSNALVSECHARCAQLVIRLLRVSESEECLRDCCQGHEC